MHALFPAVKKTRGASATRGRGVFYLTAMYSAFLFVLGECMVQTSIVLTLTLTLTISVCPW